MSYPIVYPPAGQPIGLAPPSHQSPIISSRQDEPTKDPRKRPPSTLQSSQSSVSTPANPSVPTHPSQLPNQAGPSSMEAISSTSYSGPSSAAPAPTFAPSVQVASFPHPEASQQQQGLNQTLPTLVGTNGSHIGASQAIVVAQGTSGVQQTSGSDDVEMSDPHRYQASQTASMAASSHHDTNGSLPLTINPAALSLKVPAAPAALTDPIKDEAEMAPSSEASSPAALPINDHPLFNPETPGADEDGPVGQPSPMVTDEQVDELQDDDDDDDDEEEVPLSKMANASKPVASTSKEKIGSPAPPKAKKKRPSTTQNHNLVQASTIPLPHHTVTRAAHPSEATPNILHINPGITDGIASRWPTAEECVPGRKLEGRVNWFEPQGPGDFKYEGFMSKCGSEVATLMELSTETAGGKKQPWVLGGFPQNYRLYIHHTFTSGKDRTDTYVFGSIVTAKFRTANELSPHLASLILSGPGNNLICGCKYCSGKTQGEVNQKNGFTVYNADLHSSQGFSGSASERVKRKSDEGTSPTAKKVKIGHSSTAPKPKKVAVEKEKGPIQPIHSGAYVSKDRSSDLQEGALFRRGEMVWASLEKPFVDESGKSNISLHHWPGIIKSRQPNIISKRVSAVGSAEPRIHNEQRWAYTVSLLALSDDVVVAESDLLPWLAHPPPSEIYQNALLDSEKSVKLVWNGVEVLRPNLSMMQSVFHAITPFALAMQIAAHVVSCYSLGDRFPIKESHIQSHANRTDAEKKEIKAHLKKSNYQALWWGCELIWTGELVRLLPDGDPIPVSSRPKAGYSRSLFFKIESIYKDPTGTSASGNGVIMISGSVYQLVPTSVPFVAPASNGTPLGHIPLPPPPPGFNFKRITPEKSEVVLDAECLAGRYVPLPPRLASSPKDVARVVQGVATPAESSTAEDDPSLTMDSDTRAIALAGLVPAHNLLVRCCHWKLDRVDTITYAENTAATEMKAFFKRS